MKKKFMKTCTAAALTAALAITTVAPAFAADLTPKYTYSGDGMTFEKVSHANSPTETADGIVDYTAVSPLTFRASVQTAMVTAVNPTAMHLHLMATGSTSTPCTAAWVPMLF